MNNNANSIAAADKNIQGMSGIVQSAIKNELSSLLALQTQLLQVADASKINGVVNVDVSAALSALASIISMANKALSALSSVGSAKNSAGSTGNNRDDTKEVASPSPSSGSSGGSSSPSTPTATASVSAYEAAITSLEHLKAVGKETYDQELSYLQKILATRKKYNLSTAELNDLLERIYSVQTAIAARDAESVDTLANGIVAALTERYQAQQQAELDQLDESKQAWKAWRDSVVGAIEDQIDALDAQAESEDREAAKAEALRKVASLKQQLTYEQDAYNRAKLTQQLEAAQAAYDKLISKYEREDQKAALEEAIKAVEERAQAEIDVLDAQQKQVEAVYAKRLETAALNAEAEKVLMNSTQQDIIDLIASYAPEYNSTGESLGEKLYEGFLSKVGGIEAWFANFNAMWEAAQKRMAEAATQASDTLGASSKSVTITNTNQFYVQADSPSAISRKIQDANENLAAAILAG